MNGSRLNNLTEVQNHLPSFQLEIGNPIETLDSLRKRGHPRNKVKPLIIYLKGQSVVLHTL